MTFWFIHPSFQHQAGNVKTFSLRNTVQENLERGFKVVILLPSSFNQLKQLRTNLYNCFVVQDLQLVKTYFVFSVHTMSSTATFPQLHTKNQPSAVRAAVEKQNPLASFT